MMLPSALNDHGCSSPLWLVLCKVTLTIGEMLVLPSALSLLGSLAPPQQSGLLSGLSFGAQALGFWVGGLLGAQWEQWSSTTYFAVQAILGIATAALVTFGAQVRSSDPHRSAQK
jgi:dipeptide/tripeptide permease